MEEEKAAEYYNELFRKGGNAAKFKQGLGFGAQATSVSNRTTSVAAEEKYLSLSNFVKGSGKGKAASLDEEVRIERIVEKLQKPRSSKPSYPEGVGEKSSYVTHSKEHVREKTPYSYESGERVKEKPGRSVRSPMDETKRAPEKRPSSRERRGRSRELSRISGRKFSRSSSDDNSSKSPTKCRKRSTRRGSDESASYRDDYRSRHGRKTSSSYKGARRQGRDYSHEIRRKQRSRSPPSRGNDFYNHAENMPTGRLASERERECDKRDERSSGRHRDGKNGATDSSQSSRAKEKAPEWDYFKLRPNADTMTPGEKLKAKTKVQDTVMNHPTMGTSNGWERFDFDKNAPLDDDAKLDYFGDSTGAGDDTLFLKNTGSSYLSSHSQVKREALAAAKHEASIFGVPEGPSLKKLEPARDARESPPRDLGIVDKIISNEERDCKIVTPPMNTVLSEQVLAMQKTGSWQDRAQKMRNARVNLP